MDETKNPAATFQARVEAMCEDIVVTTRLTDDQVADLSARISDPGPIASSEEVDEFFERLLSQNNEP